MKTAIAIGAAISFSLTLFACAGEDDGKNRDRKAVEAEYAAIKAEEKQLELEAELAKQRAIVADLDEQISQTEWLLENAESDADREAAQKRLQDLRAKRRIAEKGDKPPNKSDTRVELSPECLDNPLSPNCK